MLIRQINENPRVADDSDFRSKLDEAAEDVDDLLDDARRTGGKYGALSPFTKVNSIVVNITAFIERHSAF